MMDNRMTGDHLSFLMDMIDCEVKHEFINEQLWEVFAELDRARANEEAVILELAALKVKETER